MENNKVGYLIMGIAVVMLIMVVMFNSVIKDNLDLTCTHGDSCQMYDNLNIQTIISYILIAIIFIIGVVIMFTKPKEKIIIKHKTKTIVEKKKPLDLSKLDQNEKKVIEMLQEENGGMFQKTLMEKMEIGKVGMTRLLDKLEAKQFIERKRRGMNNFVVLRG